MVHINSRFDALLLKEFSGEVEDVRIVTKKLLVALEVSHIDGIKPQKSRPESDIGFCKAVTCKVSLLRENILNTVKGGKELFKGIIIRCLRCSKTTAMKKRRC